MFSGKTEKPKSNISRNEIFTYVDRWLESWKMKNVSLGKILENLYVRIKLYARAVSL